jgi:hypothetical protein
MNNIVIIYRQMTNSKIKTGGKVIASGGFGCVFSPSLKCKGKKRDKNKISKVMTRKHAIAEYNEITSIQKKVNDIPNYKEYFLVDNFTLCEPEKLSSSDLENFKKKCSALPKNDIDKSNINNSLTKIMSLNMPDGGVPVDDYIYDNGSFEKLMMVSKSLLHLLNNGIIPMNKRNIYHSDIKDSNVLVKKNKNGVDTKLIDWGLSVEYTPKIEQKFPKPWRNRPLQFNVPFSVILFTDTFVEKYTKYIKEGGKPTAESLKPFVLDYFYTWMKKRGAGHYKFINSIMFMLFSNELENMKEDIKLKMVETQFTMNIIINYIIEILVHFTRFRENGTLNLREYLDNVFIHNVDIWGFIMVFYPALEVLYNNYKNLNKNQHLIYSTIKGIFVEHCYESAITPINIQKLNSDCKKLSILFENETSSLVKSNIRNINKKTRKQGVTGQTYMPSSSVSTKSYFIKPKKNATKKAKRLIFAPNKNKR